MRKLNLVFTTIYCELDREEMTYVDGGVYLSNSQVQNRLTVVGLFGAPSLPKVIAAMSKGISKIAAKICAIPNVGWVLASVVTIYLGAHLYDFATTVVDATLLGKGIDIQAKWLWEFIPYLDFQAR